MNLDYQALSRKLHTTLREVAGVISVGVGKQNSRHVLVVAIDPETYVGGIPNDFEGVKVVRRKLGLAKFF
jgi:hypothetical protein